MAIPQVFLVMRPIVSLVVGAVTVLVETVMVYARDVFAPLVKLLKRETYRPRFTRNLAYDGPSAHIGLAQASYVGPALQPWAPSLRAFDRR